MISIFIAFLRPDHYAQKLTDSFAGVSRFDGVAVASGVEACCLSPISSLLTHCGKGNTKPGAGARFAPLSLLEARMQLPA